MKSPKYLLIPDIHLRHQIVEKIIEFEKPDFAVFLGDYWDDFGDTPNMIRKTAEWFHWSVNQPNRIHLTGNHDLHYWFKDNHHLRCSGYEQYKSFLINEFVTEKDWEKLKFFYILDNKWLLSHAGVHPSWISSPYSANKIYQYSLDELKTRLQNESVDAKKAFYQNKIHWFGIAGFSRSGSPYYGGICWLDWNKEFHPIHGIHQLVGHSPQYNLVWKNIKKDDKITYDNFTELSNEKLTDKNSYNLCLDSQPGSRFYGIYENEKLEIRETSISQRD